MEKKIKSLERKIYGLGIYALTLTLAMIYLIGMEDQDEVLRTKGIVIEDSQGRPRILLGSPTPLVNERIRTNDEKAKEAWEEDFWEGWFDMYKEYDHDTYGLLILDENGHDRLALGNPVPDLYFGKRIGPLTGLAINNDNGQERTGYGMIELENGSRVNLGLDHENGTEGLVLTLDENGTTGFFVKKGKKQVFLGKADTANWYTNGVFPFLGLQVSDSLGVVNNLEN